jgi:hypothetical protein
MWFIGLELNRDDPAIKNIDLTQDIQSFTDTSLLMGGREMCVRTQYFAVVGQASYANSFRDGMHVDCRHVKKKDLVQVWCWRFSIIVFSNQSSCDVKIIHFDQKWTEICSLYKRFSLSASALKT